VGGSWGEGRENERDGERAFTGLEGVERVTRWHAGSSADPPFMMLLRIFRYRVDFLIRVTMYIVMYRTVSCGYKTARTERRRCPESLQTQRRRYLMACGSTSSSTCSSQRTVQARRAIVQSVLQVLARVVSTVLPTLPKSRRNLICTATALVQSCQAEEAVACAGDEPWCLPGETGYGDMRYATGG
jgi:hypothetical protein